MAINDVVRRRLLSGVALIAYNGSGELCYADTAKGKNKRGKHAVMARFPLKYVGSDPVNNLYFVNLYQCGSDLSLDPKLQARFCNIH